MTEQMTIEEVKMDDRISGGGTAEKKTNGWPVIAMERRKVVAEIDASECCLMLNGNEVEVTGEVARLERKLPFNRPSLSL